MQQEPLKQTFTNRHFTWRYTRENRPSGALAGTSHYDESMVITYLIHGTGTLWVEGHTTPIQEGDLLLLNPNEFHRCFFDAHPQHERLSIYLHSSLAESFCVSSDSLFAAFLKRPLGQWNVIPGAFLHEQQIDSLLLSMKYPALDDEDAAVVLQCQVVQLLRLLNHTMQQMQAGPQYSVTNKTVSRAIEHINRHLTEELSTAAIAKALFVDKSYLCRVFKTYTGATLSDYISKKRIDYATKLIANGLSRTEACYKSGFGNYSSFYRYYQRYKKSEHS